ncbi:MAG: TIGR03118 family protein [Ferruginibacter sp.]
MKTNYPLRYFLSRACILLFATLLVVSCNKNKDNIFLQNAIQPKLLNTFIQKNLVANVSDYNPVTIDPTLINAWGIAFSGTGTAWPNSTDGHVSEVYTSAGLIARPPVNIPGPGGMPGGSPTGIVFNGGSDFVLPAPNSAAARFIFVGEDGVISGWNGGAGSNAVLIKDNSATAAYTGLTSAMKDFSNLLYAANFKAGTIDVFDKDFNPVWMPFKDPGLPQGYSPFNIQAIGNLLYVAYAKVDPSTGDEEAGIGKGYISIFNKGGTFVKRFASGGQLNAPWGMARTPSTFFQSSQVDPASANAILIGNFGDGRINAYSPAGWPLGVLAVGKKPIVIPGLWAITFAPATATSIDSNKLFFAAGPRGETDGLFGYLVRTLK